MKPTMKSVLILTVVFACMTGAFQAGDLEPSGPPAPTMVTLQQIYDRIGAGAAGPGRTGQTACWNATGSPVACAGTGQDGEHQAGVAVSPRFTDRGNGTVKDNLTGLIWTKNANCFGFQNWTTQLNNAKNLANGTCGLTDGSVAGNWRLANAKELQSLIDFGQSSPALPTGNPFVAVLYSNYWSSTSSVTSTATAWAIDFTGGWTSNQSKTNVMGAWPVRNGP